MSEKELFDHITALFEDFKGETLPRFDTLEVGQQHLENRQKAIATELFEMVVRSNAELRDDLKSEIRREIDDLRSEIRQDSYRLRDELESIKSFQAHQYSGGPIRPEMATTLPGSHVNEPSRMFKRFERPLRR